MLIMICILSMLHFKVDKSVVYQKIKKKMAIPCELVHLSRRYTHSFLLQKEIYPFYFVGKKTQIYYKGLSEV
jgi:hypothetical protein